MSGESGANTTPMKNSEVRSQSLTKCNKQGFSYVLTPNRPLAHTSFTYRKLNMDGFSALNDFLGYVDTTQEKEWNSLHAQSLFQKIFFTS